MKERMQKISYYTISQKYMKIYEEVVVTYPALWFGNASEYDDFRFGND